MILREQVIPLLLEACPSYRARWDACRTDDDFDVDLLYVHLGDFARHVVELLGREPSGEVVALADAVERLLVDGDAFVREAATIGILEAIQNQAQQRHTSTRALEAALGPEARRWWTSVDAFWTGVLPFIGADITKGST